MEKEDWRAAMNLSKMAWAAGFLRGK